MEILKSTAELICWRNSLTDGSECVLVPTMGGLHLGHQQLIEQAKAVKKPNDLVVSIFLNPLQFDDANDLENYPTNWTNDHRLLENLMVDAVFYPEPKDFLPRQTMVVPGDLGDPLHGKARKGHLSGVCTVVMKLLTTARPDHVFFGEKDYQQLLVIKAMVSDYDLPVTVHSIATVREESGLAYSTRNMRLSKNARSHVAPMLRAALVRTLAWWQRSEPKPSPQDLASYLAGYLSHPLITTEYIEVLNRQTLKPVTANEPAMIFVSIFIEGINLIDHIELLSTHLS